jgi:hypothetical protein
MSQAASNRPASNRSPARAAGSLLRAVRESGDGDIGQGIVRLAALAAAAHQYEHAAALAAQGTCGKASIQARVHGAASEPVRMDAGLGALSRLRREVGR